MVDTATKFTEPEVFHGQSETGCGIRQRNMSLANFKGGRSTISVVEYSSIVNDLIDAPLSNIRLLSNGRPHENYFKILGISKKEQNHSIYRAFWLFNKGVRIASCLMSTSKLRFERAIWICRHIDGLDVALFIKSLDILAESILVL